jgi:hypothetical protein
MCSIEEAWAGQTFSGKPVVSQGDIHKAYMSLPDDISLHNNQFSLKTSTEPTQKYLTRGINSKYSREPRVPKINRNSNDANINLSSTMPPYNNYGGIDNVPDYMSIYDKTAPMPNMNGGEQFMDIENAYNVSNSVNEFMDIGKQNQLLTEDNDEESRIITTKLNNKLNNKQNQNNFMNIKPRSKYDSSDNSDSSYKDDISIPDSQGLIILQQIISRLDNIEHNLNKLHTNQSRNMYDIVLYIIFGMILSFILYSIICKK